jgi:hypothetical protein
MIASTRAGMPLVGQIKQPRSGHAEQYDDFGSRYSQPVTASPANTDPVLLMACADPRQVVALVTSPSALIRD